MEDFFPRFQAEPAVNMMEMGITRRMYEQLQKVAEANHCVIMVRKTNKGSVMPFANRTAVGKKLATKGKSSAAFFTKGNIAFLAEMAKKLNSAAWFKEQMTLINTMEELRGAKSKYKFIPKFLTENQLETLITEGGSQIKNITVEKVDEIESKVIEIKDYISSETETTEVTYKLIKKTWREIPGYKEYVKPHPDLEDEDEVYQVYAKFTEGNFPVLGKLNTAAKCSVAAADINDDKLKRLKESAGSGNENNPVPIEIKTINNEKIIDITIDKIIAEELWLHMKSSGSRKIKEALENFQDCAPKLNGTDFREVRVLAILTTYEGNQAPTESNPRTSQQGTTKKYFEVVADYDIFMIAPRINKIEFDAGDEKSKYKVNDLYITLNNQKLSVLPVMGQHKSIRHRDDGKNPYGLLSPYDFYVRKEINKALGIKVAQHGAEVANLFYTSDIKDPVITIYPKEIKAGNPAEAPLAMLLASKFENEISYFDQVVNGPCFLMSMEMLFKMMTGSSEEETILQPQEIANTYTNSIRYSVNATNYTSLYGILFNLNWGSDQYYKFNNITNTEEYERSIIAILNKYAEVEEVKSFFGYISEYEKLPVSVKAFLAFLFLKVRRMVDDEYQTGAALFVSFVGMRRAIRRLRPGQSSISEPQTNSQTTTGSETSPENIGSSSQPDEADPQLPAVLKEKNKNTEKYLMFLQRYYSAVLSEIKSQKNEELNKIYKSAIKAIVYVRFKFICQKAKELDREIGDRRVMTRKDREKISEIKGRGDLKVINNNDEINRILQPGWCANLCEPLVKDDLKKNNEVDWVLYLTGAQHKYAQLLQWYNEIADYIFTENKSVIPTIRPLATRDIVLSGVPEVPTLGTATPRVTTPGSLPPVTDGRQSASQRTHS